MIAMDRRSSLLLVIAVFIVVLFAGYLITQRYILPVSGPEGIAFADPEIRGAALSHLGQNDVGAVMPLGQDGMAGYIGLNDSVMLVPISIGSDVIDHWFYKAYVDLNTGNVIGKEQYYRLYIPNDMSITIPPGTAWYYRIMGGTRVGMGLKPEVLSVEPNGSNTYAFIADDWGLKNIPNSSVIDTSAWGCLKAGWSNNSTYVDLVNANSETDSPRYFLIVNADKSTDVRVDTSFFPA